MVSKPKKGRPRKVVSEPVKVEVKEQVKPKVTQEPVKKTPEQLVEENGRLAENLLNSLEWKTIVAPILHERIASVSGRFTNGRYYHGSFTRQDKISLEFQQGYQKAMMDINNDVLDFVVAKKNQDDKKKAEVFSAQQPMVGPLDEEE